MDRRSFLRAVAALTGAAALPALPAAQPPSVFGLEALGFTEEIYWHERFAAWMVVLRKDVNGRLFEYARLMEDDPRTQPETILDFYRDDAVSVFEKAKHGR